MRFWFVLVVLFLAVGLSLYSPTFKADWAMDDYLVVVNNPDAQTFRGFMSNSYPGRPLRELSYIVDYTFFGRNPAGYHVQNILWHVISALLLVAVAVELKLSRWLAVMAGTIFLIHPLTVEVVANVSHRKDSLMLAFSLAAMLAFLRGLTSDCRWRWWLAAALLSAIAFSGKEPAAVLPLIFILVYGLLSSGFADRFKSQHRFEPLIWLGGGVVLAGWIYWLTTNQRFLQLIKSGMAFLGSTGETSPTLYYLAVLKAHAFIWLRIIWPVDLAFEYNFAPPQSWLDPWVVSAVAIFIALLGVWRWGIARAPVVAIGIAWFLLFLVPATNLFWPASYFAADRYMYAPLAGLLLATAGVAQSLGVGISGQTRRLWWVVPVAAGLAVLTWRQCQVWDSEMTLYQQAVKVSPDSSSALVGLSMAHYNARNLDQAYEFATAASKKNKNETKALYLLGLIYEAKGDINQAKMYLNIFLSMDGGLNPGFAQSARMRLLYYNQGKPK